MHEPPRDHGVCARHHQDRDAVHDYDHDSVVDTLSRHHWVAVIVVDAGPTLATPNLQRQLKPDTHSMFEHLCFAHRKKHVLKAYHVSKPLDTLPKQRTS